MLYSYDVTTDKVICILLFNFCAEGRGDDQARDAGDDALRRPRDADSLAAGRQLT